MKKIIFSILILFVLLAGLFFYTKNYFIKNNSEIEYIYKTSATGSKYPQIINYSDKKIQDKVNQKLSDLLSTSQCEQTDYFDEDSKVTYNINDIFAVDYSIDYSCKGAAHPDSVDAGYVFDMKTGEPVNFLDLFKDWNSTNSDKFVDYSHDKQVINLVFGEIIKKGEKENDALPEDKRWANNPYSDSCLGFNTFDTVSDSGFLDATFKLSTTTPDKVIFREQLAHAVKACEEENAVDIKDLLPVLKKDSILYRIYNNHKI